HVVLFFFQAEDGIRDWSVTGVQTCALPIFVGKDLAFFADERGELEGVEAAAGADVGDDVAGLEFQQRQELRGLFLLFSLGPLERSEERRVGKEGGFRGSAGHVKEKQQWVKR